MESNTILESQHAEREWTNNLLNEYNATRTAAGYSHQPTN